METLVNKKILFVCGREASYARNKILIQKLRQQRNQLSIISSSKKSFISRHIDIIFKITSLSFRKGKIEAIFIGFYGYLIVPLLKILYPRKPLFFDAFISTYESVIEDSSKFEQLGPVLGKIFKTLAHDKKFLKIFYLLDKISLSLSDKVFIDTLIHKEYFIKTYNLSPGKIKVEYLGYDKEIFHPKKVRKADKYKNKFLVFYYGTGQMLQGIDVILQAAKICEKNEKIHFLILGPIRKMYPQLIKN